MSQISLLLYMLQLLIHKGSCAFLSNRFGYLKQSISTATMSTKKDSPSAERNKQPIWDILQSKVLPSSSPNGTLQVLEIAAGAGVHTHFFAINLLKANIPVRWTPSDPDTTSLASIDAYIDEERNDRLRTCVANPLKLTLEADGIVEEATRSCLEPSSLDLVIAINLIHISPWSATLGLMKTAGRLLKNGGKLYLYGAYRIGRECVESNLRFEEWLQSLDPSYGVRDLEDVVAAARSEGLLLLEQIEMPANNLSVVFQKQ